MFNELVLIEVLVTFIVMFSVVTETADGHLGSLILGVALVDKGDSIAEWQVEHMGNIVWFHGIHPFCAWVMVSVFGHRNSLVCRELYFVKRNKKNSGTIDFYRITPGVVTTSFQTHEDRT